MARKRGRFSIFVIGSALGAIAGLLFAPKKGEEMREDIKRRTDDLMKQGRDAYDTQREKITSAIETGKTSAGEKADNIRDRIEDTRKRLQEQVDEAKKRVRSLSEKAEKKAEVVKKEAKK